MSLEPRSVVGAPLRCSPGLSAFGSKLCDGHDGGVLCVVPSTRAGPGRGLALEGPPGSTRVHARSSCSPLRTHAGLHTVSFHPEADVGG